MFPVSGHRRRHRRGVKSLVRAIKRTASFASKRSASSAYNFDAIQEAKAPNHGPPAKKRKLHHRHTTHHAQHRKSSNDPRPKIKIKPKSTRNELAPSSNQQRANLFVSGYIRQYISGQVHIPTEIKSICSNFYGLWRFLDSSIINKRQAQILSVILSSKLKPRSAPHSKNIVLDLLYRHSDDQTCPDSYHKACHGKKNIVVLIKSNYNRVFGGYTSSVIYDEKHKSHYNKDTNSFLFSINNSVRKSNIFPIKRKYSNYSTFNVRTGPVFGHHDIHLNGNHSFCAPKCYQIIDGSRLCGKDIRRCKPYLLLRSNQFKVINYEVYKIKLT
eukprot:35363_1